MTSHELRIRVISSGGQAGTSGSGSVPQQASPQYGPWPIQSPQGPVFGPPAPQPAGQPARPAPQPVPVNPPRPARQPRVSTGGMAGSLASVLNVGVLTTALTRYQAINQAIGDIASGMERATKKRKRDAERLQKRKDRAFRRMNRTRRKMGLLPRARRRETRIETFRRVVKEIGQDAMSTRAGQFVANSPIGRAAAAVRRRFVPAAPNFNVHGPRMGAGMAQNRMVPPGRFTGAVNAVRRAAPGAMQAMSPAALVAPALAIMASTGAAAVALKMFTASVERTAERIGNLAPGTAGAMAQRDARQITGDVRRAQLLDRDMARMVNLNSQLSQDMQDIKAVLMKAGIQLAAPLLESLSLTVNAISKFLQDNGKNLELLVKIAGHTSGITLFTKLQKELVELAKGDQPEPMGHPEHWIDELMRMQFGPPEPPPPGKPAF